MPCQLHDMLSLTANIYRQSLVNKYTQLRVKQTEIALVCNNHQQLCSLGPRPYEQVCHETIFGPLNIPFSTNIGLNGRPLVPNLVDFVLL